MGNLRGKNQKGKSKMNKHFEGSLEQLQSLDLNSKIMLTQARIKAWYEHFNGQVYISFSGGKDSTVYFILLESYIQM